MRVPRSPRPRARVRLPDPLAAGGVDRSVVHGSGRRRTATTRAGPAPRTGLRRDLLRQGWAALLLFGHERNAKDNANDLLLAMDGNNLEAAGEHLQDSPSYVVHPPFGKWVIAAGQWAFGANPFGWRIAVAVLGILSVVLLARIVRRMTGSNLLGSIAGFPAGHRRHGHRDEPYRLLDGILAFMVLLAFGALLLDRDRTRRLWPKRSLRPWR